MVALADKLETLVGMFGIGQLPSGDKDPFALRRHALGVVRMLIEASIPLDLAIDSVGEVSFRFSRYATSDNVTFGTPVDPNVNTLVSDFIYERLAGSLREQGYSAHEVDAVSWSCGRSGSAIFRSAWRPCVRFCRAARSSEVSPLPTSASATS
ncbi:MAG: glycine--tRNA ligase subunit beta [Rhodocyclaceae bacterium]|nr:glycine--tRNA ligase subunit beta [Rhodocyclaceae bacterium]